MYKNKERQESGQKKYKNGNEFQNQNYKYKKGNRYSSSSSNSRSRSRNKEKFNQNKYAQKEDQDYKSNKYDNNNERGTKSNWDQKQSNDDFNNRNQYSFQQNNNSKFILMNNQNNKSYKTAMCPQILNSNGCFKGDRCTFAHSSSELNQNKNNKFTTASQVNFQNQKEQKQIANTILQQQTLANANYKTMLCKNFNNGNCRYGDKCTFSHGQQDLRQRSTQQALAMAAQYEAQDEVDLEIPANNTQQLLNQFMNPYVLAALDFNAAPELDQNFFNVQSQMIINNIQSQLSQQKEAEIQQMIIQKQLEEQARLMVEKQQKEENRNIQYQSQE